MAAQTGQENYFQVCFVYPAINASTPPTYYIYTDMCLMCVDGGCSGVPGFLTGVLGTGEPEEAAGRL